jgi:Arc/MetJ family transcription regulator
MRTNIVLDDELMIQALKSGGFKTKKAAIEQGLKLLVQINSQKKLRELKGKIVWEGDLEAMRSD